MTAEPLNLLRDPWLPALRRSGRTDTIRPAQIAEPDTDDPVTEIVWPRPDFRIAAIEFLIGLLSSFVPPEDEIDWREWWAAPPGAATLDAGLAPYAHAFTLDGDGPRFMQDFNALADGAENDAGALLIEAPGARTLRNNADLLIKRGRIARLGRPAAAMALFTLQTYAPGGGAGHRVGLRGGGPLTTLVVPEAADGGPATLWHLVWANVQPGQPVPPDRLSRVLPWLAPTPTSEKSRTALAAGLEPAHAFWGMPRRIRLDFAPNPDGLACDLTGAVDAVTVATWRTRPHGIFYQSWAPPHPLSPHYQSKKTEPFLPLHGQPAGIGYRDWVGLVLNDDGRRPADTVNYFRNHRSTELRQYHARLFAAGYDIYQNAKVRGFVESEMPLPPIIACAAVLDDHIRALIHGASAVSDLLRSAARSALVQQNTKASKEIPTTIAALEERLWRETAPGFHERVYVAARQPGVDRSALTRPWLNTLCGAALRCFDAAAPLDPDQFRDSNAGPSIVRSRGFLTASLAGYRTGGRKLFEILGLTLPEPARSKKARRLA